MSTTPASRACLVTSHPDAYSPLMVCMSHDIHSVWADQACLSILSRIRCILFENVAVPTSKPKLRFELPVCKGDCEDMHPARRHPEALRRVVTHPSSIFRYFGHALIDVTQGISSGFPVHAKTTEKPVIFVPCFSYARLCLSD